MQWVLATDLIVTSMVLESGQFLPEVPLTNLLESLKVE